MSKLTGLEIAFCIAALGQTAASLREGNAASIRLGRGPMEGVLDYADQMDALKTRLELESKSPPKEEKIILTTVGNDKIGYMTLANRQSADGG